MSEGEVGRRDFLRIAVTGAAGLAIGGGVAYYAREAEVASLRSKVEELQAKLEIEPKPEIEKNLNIYNWTWYANLTLVEQWRKETGITLVYDFFEDLDTAITTITSGAVQYDLAVISDNEALELWNGGYLQSINLDKIPNFEYVPDAFKGLSYDPNNEFSVIYSYGTTGIGYNADFVPEGITKWEDLFDVDNPDSVIRRHAGKVTMMEDSTETLGAAAIYLGYDIDTTNESELQEIADLLIRQKQYLYGYAQTEAYMEELPVGARFYISHAWNGDVAGIVYASDEYEVYIETYYENVKYVVPEEGAIVWYDNFVIPKNARNVNAAHAYINWFLQPEVSAIHTITIKYPYPAGIKYVPKEILEDPMIFTPEELSDRLYLGKALTPEERAIREQYWTQVVTA
jgi:spermidine/putrescine transport system substrate-binding protein